MRFFLYCQCGQYAPPSSLLGCFMVSRRAAGCSHNSRDTHGDIHKLFGPMFVLPRLSHPFSIMPCGWLCTCERVKHSWISHSCQFMSSAWDTQCAQHVSPAPCLNVYEFCRIVMIYMILLFSTVLPMEYYGVMATWRSTYVIAVGYWLGRLGGVGWGFLLELRIARPDG